MRGWQYEETCFASLYLLYSLWMSTLVSTTAGGDETCRSKKQITAKSCKLWMESLRHCRARLDCPVSAVFCVCVHSVTPLSSSRSVASS